MSTNKKLENNLRWYHWVVVFSSLILTVSAWAIANQQLNERIRQSFNFQSEQLLLAIAERMADYEAGLQSGVAMLRSQVNDVDVNHWRRFARKLHLEETYPGINGMGVIFYVPPENLNSFLETQRQIRPDFSIKPEHDKNEYWPITFIEPVAINSEAVGLDMAFEENRFMAAKLARDSGTTQVTKPIILVQDKQRTPGFLQFIPFYSRDNLNTPEERREYFIGHVYAPFIMKKLINGTLNQDNRRLLFSVYDDDTLLYDELMPATTDFDDNPLLTKTRSIDVYGRPWRFTIQTGMKFRQEVSTKQPYFILAAGIIIDALLFWLFLVLSGSNSKARKLAREMTEKLYTSQIYLRHIINAAPSGICIFNSKGIIEQVNPRMVELFGYSEHELVGQSVDFLLPKRYRVHAEKEEHRQQDVQTDFIKLLGNRTEISCRTKQEGEFPARVGLAQFESNNDVKAVATVIDITDLAHVTDDLRRSNKELNNFAYVASHDLKTPLRGIIQLSEWIFEDLHDTVDDDTKEKISLLNNRATRLEGMLNDLLTYSRVGRKQGEVRSVNVEKMISNLMDLLDPMGETRIILNKPLPVFDTLAIPLETVFRNLLDNALKHNDKDQAIIEVSCLEEQDHYVFSVTDNGPGILPEYQHQIFDLFETLRPRDEVEGSGMGLSIIMKIFEMYGHTIEVDSDGHHGTTFRFTWFKTVPILKSLNTATPVGL